MPHTDACYDVGFITKPYSFFQICIFKLWALLLLVYKKARYLLSKIDWYSRLSMTIFENLYELPLLVLFSRLPGMHFSCLCMRYWNTGEVSNEAKSPIFLQICTTGMIYLQNNVRKLYYCLQIGMIIMALVILMKE